MRLNAYLAKAGISSRRGADKLIQAGSVMVNGRPGKLNDDVNETDLVEINGTVIKLQQNRYILLYKPEKYLSTVSDPHGRAKITDLLNVPERVVPVGRLDYDTSGAIILTNDGEFANQLMHPRYEIDKVYEAQIDKPISKGMLDLLSKSVMLEDGPTAPAKAKMIGSNMVELTIHEGRSHQVKRMLSALGLKVTKLHRSRYGNLDLSGLRPGEWRELTDNEIKALKHYSG